MARRHLTNACSQFLEANPVLLGFDVVQYHFIPSYEDGGVAVQGLPEYAYNWNGYQFWLSTKENREVFIADPWKFAPAWGGFCSWGIAREHAPAWPWQIDFLGPPASPWEGWAIVDDVLIFNIWSSYTDMFLEEGESNMKLAAQRWKDFFGDLHSGPFNTHCIGHGPLKNWCLSQQPAPWLHQLPDCSNNATGGGGIVSAASEFNDFANSSLSPYQRKWLISGAVLIPLVLLFVIYLIFRRCRKACKGQVEEVSAKPDDEEAHTSEDLPVDPEDDTSDKSPNAPFSTTSKAESHLHLNHPANKILRSN
jgi:hypothetical protein